MKGRSVTKIGPRLTQTVSRQADPAETRYGGAVDFKRAADSYAQGRTLRRIGAELATSSTTVSEQLRRAGLIMPVGALRLISPPRNPRPDLE